MTTNVGVIICEVFLITRVRGREGGRREGKKRKVERSIVRYITDVTKKLYPLVLLGSIAIYAQSPNPETRVATVLLLLITVLFQSNHVASASVRRTG